MSRFCIAHHTGSSEGDHFDLMLEFGETLRTWRLSGTHFEAQQTARQIREHRKKYLEYEGEVSGGRGNVKIWDKGTYAVDLWGDKVIQISLLGTTLQIRLRLELHKGEEWTIVDASASIRRLVSNHLRNAELDAAPTQELEDLRAALAKEEQKLLAFVSHFSKGDPVDSSALEIDTAVQARLQKEWVRWRHPWLDQARAFVERLHGLVGAVRDAKPVVPAEA
jgi:hypothetical protein